MDNNTSEIMTDGSGAMGSMWTYRNDVIGDGGDLIGFGVEAKDGHIGKIDAATTDTDRLSVVVDTGFWIFGKKRLIPAGVVLRINRPEQKVFINLTKDEVKEAPEYHDDGPSVGTDTFYDPYDQYYRAYI